jgi:uncharacterized repeat protein (TIGR01451 family)
MDTRRRWSRTPRVGVVVVAAALATVGPASAALASGGTSFGADLQVSGSASTGSPNAGAPLNYTFLVKNSGPETATSVVLSDPLPAGTVYNYATANGSTIPCAAFGNLSGGATVSCDLGSIAKGGQATVVVSVNAPLSPAIFSNTGTVRSSTADPSATNNSVTVTAEVRASGGGINKNGVNDVPGTTTVACASLLSVSAPVGYYSVWAAVWNTFTVRSCANGSESLNVRVTETNASTGLVDYDITVPLTLGGGANSSMVLDNDFAPFNTTYNIAFTVSDLSGNSLATASVTATTPPPQ